MANSRAAQIVAAIPARYGSTRLPGKPLAKLAGKTIIEHVYTRVSAVRGLTRVVVLTDDERIADAVAAFGGEHQMTPETCASGSDRIAWAARDWDEDAVVNVQGDEPLIEPAAVEAIAAHLAAAPQDEIVTLASPAANEILEQPHRVKVVLNRRGYALYFSRAPIPVTRDGAAPGTAPVLQHLGIYGYQRAALLHLASLDPTPLERSEALEQLRALEHGMSIRVLMWEGEAAPGVDTAQDLLALEARLQAASERDGTR